MTAEASDGDRVAIAIVSFDERDLLARCLCSLEADAAADRAEVWVVDNASSDGSPEMVEREFPWVRLIANEENLGYGPAVNLVAERTDAGWIAPANQDIELDPGALQVMVAAAAGKPRVGSIAPRFLGSDGTTQHSVYPFPTLWVTLLFNLGVHRLSHRLADRLCLEGHWDPQRAREVPWAIAAFIVVNREAFEAVGRFDNAMWLHAEDLDLAWRLDRAGWRIWYEPSAVVRHAGSVSTRKAFGSNVEARFMAASYAWMARRRGTRLARAVALVNFAGSRLRAAALLPAVKLRPHVYLEARDGYARWARIHARAVRSSRLLEPR